MLLITLLAVPAGIVVADTAVIPVRFHPAPELANRLQPVVEAGESILAHGDRLVVQASGPRISALRKLVRELDTPPQRLLISVRERGEFNTDTAGGETTGTAWRWQTRSRNDSGQRVQTINGRPAMIRYGSAVPVRQVRRQIINGRPVERYAISYRDSLTGFQALPRVQGDQVTVEIYHQSDRPSVRTGRFGITQARAILRGRLGEWLTLSGLSGHRSGHREGRQARTRRAQDRIVELQVTALD